MAAVDDIDWVAMARNEKRGSPRGAAILAGSAAYHAGKPLDSNPFSGVGERPLFDGWRTGWQLGRDTKKRFSRPVKRRGGGTHASRVAEAMEDKET